MSHAKENGALRSQRHEHRKVKIVSVCDLHSGDETKASRKEKVVDRIARLMKEGFSEGAARIIATGGRPVLRLKKATKELGSHGTIKAAGLQVMRDQLFDKWLDACDKYEKWKSEDINFYTGMIMHPQAFRNNDYKRTHWRNLEKIMLNNIKDLQLQMINLDERITRLPLQATESDL